MKQSLKEFFNQDYLNQIVYGDNDYPRGLLGPHLIEDGLVISVYNSAAKSIDILTKNGMEFPTTMIENTGVF